MSTSIPGLQASLGHSQRETIRISLTISGKGDAETCHESLNRNSICIYATSRLNTRTLVSGSTELCAYITATTGHLLNAPCTLFAAEHPGDELTILTIEHYTTCLHFLSAAHH